MKVAFFDIEATALEAEFGQLLCAVIGAYHPDKPTNPVLMTLKLENYNNANRWDDSALALAIREELEQYDLVISYNGARYDIPFVNTRLAEVGERSMVIKRHKDLLYVMRGRYRLGSNRLARVTQFLFGETQKTSIDPKTWRKAICGDQKAYNYIIEHCRLDVIELARVWDVVKDNAGVLR